MANYICKDCKTRISFIKRSHSFGKVTYQAKCQCHDTGECGSRFICDCISDTWIDKREVYLMDGGMV